MRELDAIVLPETLLALAEDTGGVSDEEPTYFGGNGGLLYPLWRD